VNESLAADAGYYALVLMVCLPVRVASSQLSTFFSTQKILRPGMVCSIVGMALNLIFGLVLVLGFPIPGWNGFGFVACPWITTAMEHVQFLILWLIFCVKLQLHKECWPGWSSKYITKARVMKYLGLYTPGAFAIASDFWRVAIIGAVAASLGDRNVGIWNAGYRICWICLTFCGSIAGAMGTELNISLGAGRAEDARFTCQVSVSLIASSLVVLAFLVLSFPHTLGKIFSNDKDFLDRFAETRVPFTAFTVLMNFSTAIETILTSVGRNKTVFYAGIIGSWGGQVPFVFLLTSLWRKDLFGLYSGAAVGYGILCMLYGVAISKLDFETLAAEARERSEVSQTANEEKKEEELGASLQAVEPEGSE
jgi:Na+-driven multidrug efflux pump